MKLHDEVYMIVNKRTGAVFYSRPAKSRKEAWDALFEFMDQYPDEKRKQLRESYSKQGWRAIKVWVISNIRYRGYEFKGTDDAKEFGVKSK